jgi:arylsulfatase A-like enzyme
VPWILYLRDAPARNDTPVSLIDLFPTLLAAGLPSPRRRWRAEGSTV